MKDSLTSFNAADFSQRYRGVFGWLAEPDKPRVLVQITNIKNNQVIFQTSKSADWFAYGDQGVVFEFLPVTRGYIPTKAGVYFIWRHPARQWQRGISEHNHAIQRLSPNGLINVPVNLATISTLFEKKITYEASVMGFLEKKERVCALSSHFAIRDKVFTFMGKDAGTVEDLTTIVPNNIIKQEVQDLLNRNGWLAPFVVK